MDIHDFINVNDVRPYLTKPFRVGNHIVGTDGHRIAFRLLDEEKDVVPTNEGVSLSFVDTIKEFMGLFENLDFVPFESLDIREGEDCPVCSATGEVDFDYCDECGGRGEVEFENDFNEYDGIECKSCGRSGRKYLTDRKVVCPDCRGCKKAFWDDGNFSVLGVRVNPIYFEMLRHEPGLMLAGHDEVPKKLLFKCGEIRGLIMGMREPEKRAA